MSPCKLGAGGRRARRDVGISGRGRGAFTADAGMGGRDQSIKLHSRGFNGVLRGLH